MNWRAGSVSDRSSSVKQRHWPLTLTARLQISASKEFVVNSTQALTFLWTPWSAALSVATVAAAAVLCWLAWRRSGYARAQGLLEILRFTIVTLMAVALNQPEWVEEFRPTEKPALVVLWDDSTSMGTRDVPAGASTGSPLATRRDAIAPLTEEAAWA